MKPRWSLRKNGRTSLAESDYSDACKLLKIFDKYRVETRVEKTQGLEFADQIEMPWDRYFAALEYARGMGWISVVQHGAYHSFVLNPEGLAFLKAL